MGSHTRVFEQRSDISDLDIKGVTEAVMLRIKKRIEARRLVRKCYNGPGKTRQWTGQSRSNKDSEKWLIWEYILKEGPIRLSDRM